MREHWSRWRRHVRGAALDEILDAGYTTGLEASSLDRLHLLHAFDQLVKQVLAHRLYLQALPVTLLIGYQFPEHPQLRRRQIAAHVLGIQQDQEEPDLGLLPVVDDPGTAAFATAGQLPSDFPEAGSSREWMSGIGTLKQVELKEPVFVVLHGSGDLPSEDRRFDGSMRHDTSLADIRHWRTLWSNEAMKLTSAADG